MFNTHLDVKRLLCTIIIIFSVTVTKAQTITDGIIKKNVSAIDNPLKSILQLQPAIFEYDTENYKPLKLKAGKQYGFMAENMHQVFPGLVSTKSVSYMYGKNTYRNNNIQTIDEVSLIPVLVASIQELHKEIEQLKMEVKELRK